MILVNKEKNQRMQKLVYWSNVKYCECKYNLCLQLRKRSFLNLYEEPGNKICSGSNRRELITRCYDLMKPASHCFRKNKLRIEWVALIIKFFKTRLDHMRSPCPRRKWSLFIDIYLDSLHMLIRFSTNESHIPNKISNTHCLLHFLFA